MLDPRKRACNSGYNYDSEARCCSFSFGWKGQEEKDKEVVEGQRSITRYNKGLFFVLR